MTEAHDIRSIVAKTARILLTFALVFYTSLRVELLVAFADDKSFAAITVDDGVEGHVEGDKLDDLLIYQRVAPFEADSAAKWKPVANVNASGKGDTVTLDLTTISAEQQFLVVPVWNEKLPKDYEKSYNLEAITSAKFAAWQIVDPGGDADKKTLNSEVVTAQAIEKQNILSVAPKAVGETTVIATADDKVSADKLSVKFKIKVSEPDPPTVSALAITDAQGEAFKGDTYTVELSDLPEEGYQLHASAEFANVEFGDKTGNYVFTGENLLSAAETVPEKVLGDLVWNVAKDESAEGDEEPTVANGLLKVSSAGTYTVTCAAIDSSGGNLAVTEGKEGVVNPATLTVEVTDDEKPNPDAPSITSIEFVNEDGDAYGEDGLELSEDDLSADRQLRVHATIAGLSSEKDEYNFPADGSLAEFSKSDDFPDGAFSDLEWEAKAAEGSDASDGDISVGKDGTLKVTAAGEYTVTCTASVHAGDAAEQEGAPAQEPQVATLRVVVKGSEPVEPVKISAVDILAEDGAAFTDDQELEFKKDELPKDYTFKARVEVENMTFENDSNTYNFPEDGSLSEFSGGVFDDLEWSLTDAEDSSKPIEADIAEIDSDGTLHVKGEGTFRVVCNVHMKETDEQMPDSVIVKAGDADTPPPAEDPQGESHPQERLSISSDVELPLSASDGEGSSKTAKLDGTYELEDLEKMGESGDLAFSTTEFSMLGKSGTQTGITGYGFATLDFIEKALSDAGIDYAKAEGQIESVDFIDYAGNATTLTWGELKGASSQLALKSRVHTESGSDSSASESAPDGSDDSELLDNTRFRLLFNSTSPTVDPDAFRWIGALKIHGKTSEPEPEPSSSSSSSPSSEPEPSSSSSSGSSSSSSSSSSESESSSSSSESSSSSSSESESSSSSSLLEGYFTVSISYTPVPMGEYAEFVAVPSREIKGSWNCVWEVKDKDTGKVSVIKGETGQTLRVLTSKDTVGNEYRVTIDNERTKDANEPHYGGTSGWKTLEAVDKAEDEPRLVLSYEPPIAGQLAIFRSSVYNYKGDVSKLQYVWEWSNDGGKSWTTIAGETKPTLKIQTNPITDSDDSDDSAASLVYIRVRAYTNDNTERDKYMPKEGYLTSNVQPLTVRVGDEDTDPEKTDDPVKEEPVTEETEQPKEEKPKKEKPKKEKMKEITGITVEPDEPDEPEEPDEPDEIDEPDEPDELDDVDDPGNGEIDDFEDIPTELYINDSVTDAVNEQIAAAEEYATSTTPGARWTELKTMNPTSDDVRRVLGDNPFAPLVIPFTLGVTAAGGLEKLIFFRRQL